MWGFFIGMICAMAQAEYNRREFQKAYDAREVKFKQILEELKRKRSY